MAATSVAGSYPPTLLHWVIPSAVGFYPPLCSYPPSLGSTLCRWVLTSVAGSYPPPLPSAIGSYPPSLGRTFCHWGLPSTVGVYPPSLGYALHHWAMSFVIGLYPSLLGSSLHHSVLPFVIGFLVIHHDGWWLHGHHRGFHSSLHWCLRYESLLLLDRSRVVGPDLSSVACWGWA